VLRRGGARETLAPRASFDLDAGDVLEIATPGGGGHGARRRRSSAARGRPGTRRDPRAPGP
jgi:N-methylhydantoinase B/oxoprolinase/acetone carboxylase alpha subunit